MRFNWLAITTLCIVFGCSDQSASVGAVQTDSGVGGAGGEAGVGRAIEILRSEIERNMMLMGLPSIADISSDCVRWRDSRFLG